VSPFRGNTQPSSDTSEAGGGRLPLAFTPDSVTISGRRGDCVTVTLTVDEMLSVDDEGVTRSFSYARWPELSLSVGPDLRDEKLSRRREIATVLLTGYAPDERDGPGAFLSVQVRDRTLAGGVVTLGRVAGEPPSRGWRAACRAFFEEVLSRGGMGVVISRGEEVELIIAECAGPLRSRSRRRGRLAARRLLVAARR